MSGKVSIEAPVAADGKIEGKWYEANSELSGEIGFSGLRFVADIRTIQVEGETFPDVYVNATGLDDVAAFVAPEIASLLARAEGNWVKIDRTLLAQRQLEADAEDGTPEITLDDAKEFADRTAKVLRERLFTTDESKAVVQMEEFLGKEDFKGRAANKYKVRVNKENLKAFVDAYVAEIEDTKIIQQYIAQMPEGTTVQEAFDLDELKKSIDEVDESKAMATAWVDTGYSLLRNVRLDLSDNDATTYLDLGLAYAGGDELPFEMILSGDDEQGNIVISLGANFNQKTRATLFTATADGEIDAQKIKLDAELKLTPSDEVITPVAPTGAINVFELFGVDPSLLEAPSGSLEGSDLFFDDIQL